jgi:hypothetical protein
MSSMKEQTISNFILKQMDFSNPDKISVKHIKESIKKLTGEEPAIKFNWVKDAMVNEVSGKSKVITKLNSINIVFTDDNGEFKSVEYLL